MEKTNNIGKIMIIILLVSILASIVIETLGYAIGMDKVLIGALILLPFVFIWCVRTSK